MRILLTFPFFPFPPNDGGRIGFFNPIKYLSRSHEIIVATLTDRKDLQFIPEIEKYCIAVHVLTRGSLLDRVKLAKSVLGTPPGAAGKYWVRRFGKLIEDCVRRYDIELVEFHHLNTAIYTKYAGTVPGLLREHNVEYKIWERHATYAERPVERIYARLCAARVRAYEAEMAGKFARCITVTPADREHLLSVAPRAKVECIPSGVDTEYFYPAEGVGEEADSLVLTGSFQWKPKQHNLRVLLTDIFPRIQQKIPRAKLYVVGKGVPADLRDLAGKLANVTITGTVSDVRPFVWRSSVVLNYVESGGGIALKVLEAMAMRKAILSNSLGCEGIDVAHGREIFMADSPDDYADAAVTLLEQQSLRQRLAEAAFAKMRERYAWHVIAKQFDALYSTVLAEHGRSKQADCRAEESDSNAHCGPLHAGG